MLLKFFKKLDPRARRFICLTLKTLHIPNSTFYKELKFKGPFKIKINGKKFSMIHYGGEIENETFWKGPFKTWEKDSGWIWVQLCKSSNVIFDIGANTGIYSLIAKTINPDAKIYAFEPGINTYKKLVENINLNNSNVVPEKLAISNASKSQKFYDLPFQNQTGASLSPDKMKNWEGYTGRILEYEVDAITLSDYIVRNEIEKIDLIKIDIEMHEAEAFEGLGDYLYTFKPIVIFEVLSSDVALKLTKLINLEHFKLFHLKDSGNAEELKSFKIYDGSLSRGDWNYLLFHNSLENKMRKITSLYN